MPVVLVYHPELESPPCDKECGIGFSFIEGEQRTQYVRLESGVNRGIPDEHWEKIQELALVKRLLKCHALRVQDEADMPLPPEVVATTAAEGLVGFPVEEALAFVSDSSDIEQLKLWFTKDERIVVRNAISGRLLDIERGRA